MRRVFVDPARVNLRKAARATLVVPLVFAFLVVVENAPAALFGSFGAFAALVFADFGGARRRRFAAYLGLLAVGALLIALGTAFADTVYPAVLVMLVVAFALSFAGALGGYFAAGSTAATLGFVLAVMEPAVSAHPSSRAARWALTAGSITASTNPRVAAVEPAAK